MDLHHGLLIVCQAETPGTFCSIEVLLCSLKDSLYFGFPELLLILSDLVLLLLILTEGIDVRKGFTHKNN